MAFAVSPGDLRELKGSVGLGSCYWIKSTITYGFMDFMFMIYDIGDPYMDRSIG
jgi:hypothetical protein